MKSLIYLSALGIALFYSSDLLQAKEVNSPRQTQTTDSRMFVNPQAELEFINAVYSNNLYKISAYKYKVTPLFVLSTLFDVIQNTSANIARKTLKTVLDDPRLDLNLNMNPHLQQNKASTLLGEAIYFERADIVDLLLQDERVNPRLPIKLKTPIANQTSLSLLGYAYYVLNDFQKWEYFNIPNTSEEDSLKNQQRIKNLLSTHPDIIYINQGSIFNIIGRADSAKDLEDLRLFLSEERRILYNITTSGDSRTERNKKREVKIEQARILEDALTHRSQKVAKAALEILLQHGEININTIGEGQQNALAMVIHNYVLYDRPGLLEILKIIFEVAEKAGQTVEVNNTKSPLLGRSVLYNYDSKYPDRIDAVREFLIQKGAAVPVPQTKIEKSPFFSWLKGCFDG